MTELSRALRDFTELFDQTNICYALMGGIADNAIMGTRLARAESFMRWRVEWWV